MGDRTTWGTIQNRAISFPMDVDELNAATLVFPVPAGPAAALLPGDAFEAVESVPGSATLVIAAVDYRRNPWGDYDELNLGLLARPVGAPPEVVGSYVWRMPVNQGFTCEAGNRVMGFPKTVEDITVAYTGELGAGEVSFRLEVGGVRALTLRMPRAAATGPLERITAESYSYLDGAPFATPLEMDVGTGLVDAAEVVLDVGEGTVADELRALGLPAAPDLATWGEGLSATFQLGRPVAPVASGHVAPR